MVVEPRFAQQAYVFSEPFVAEQSGVKVRSLLVSDLGFNPYASLLIANGDLLKSKPDVARRMTAASLRGWGERRHVALLDADSSAARDFADVPVYTTELDAGFDPYAGQYTDDC